MAKSFDQKSFFWVALLVLIASVMSYSYGFRVGERKESYTFLRVIDGDTFVVESNKGKTEKRVRLLGIDAPKTGECASESAKEKLEILIGSGKFAINKVGDDNFGNTVANVLISDGDIAEKLLVEGLAKVDDGAKDNIGSELKPKEEYLRVLRVAENKAKMDQVGIWSKKCVLQAPK